ncbi:MAG: signal peptidase II [Alphaproteobacteria bacterium]
MKKLDQPHYWAIWVAIAAFIADQASKNWLLYGLQLKDDPRIIDLFPSFSLVMVWNRGVSFGLFNHQENQEINRWVLSLVGVVMVGVIVFWLKQVQTKWPAIAGGLIIGGALGNVLDRLIHGAVADFFDFYIGTWHWPAFNIADACITVGVAIILLQEFVRLPMQGKKNSNSEEKS